MIFKSGIFTKSDSFLARRVKSQTIAVTAIITSEILNVFIYL